MVQTLPVTFWDERLRAPKGYFSGTHRMCRPGDTLERIAPMLPIAGVTRCADITGLDRLGIPVTLAIRPNASTLVGSTGKGLTLPQALVSGQMEALEMHHAEHPQLPVTVASHREVTATAESMISVDALPLAREHRFTRDAEIGWVPAFDIAREVPGAVPEALVRLGPRPAVPRSVTALFQTTTNGLASGNSLVEAICAGLYEVVERDATMLYRLARDERGTTVPPIDLSQVRSEPIRWLAQRFRDAGVMLLVREVTSDVGIPTFDAEAFDAGRRGADVCGGSGTHLDVEIAMCRAITEVAQSRAVLCAGSRDDISRLGLRLNRALALAGSDSGAHQVAPRPQTTAATDSFEGDIHEILRRLRAVGLEQVMVADLRHADRGVDVVKVIVPGLEGARHPLYVPGPRAMARVFG